MAPVFRETKKLFAFKGKEWRFNIPVRDPEGQPITYEFVGQSHGIKISSAGVLSWFPTDFNETYKFTVKASDSCGNSSSYQFEVETKSCPCDGKNGGICVWGTEAKPLCKCPPGCTGNS